MAPRFNLSITSLAFCRIDPAETAAAFRHGTAFEDNGVREGGERSEFHTAFVVCKWSSRGVQLCPSVQRRMVTSPRNYVPPNSVDAHPVVPIAAV